MVEPPKKIGPYAILRKIGEGGMGAVFEGVHELIERHVAVKVLHPEFAQRPEFVSRFFNEARAVNRIDHPGLVQISDYGQLPDKSAYIVMELLRGESLAARMKSRAGPLGLAQVLNFGYQLADSLAAAHDKEVIHRDLKPDNVMIVLDPQAPGGERTKLLDFGIDKLADDNEQLAVRTSTNAIMGTPYYMSPEQCRGAGQVDSRADVYALGVMLYEMLCGERPIRGEGHGEIIAKHLTEEPAPLLSKAPQVPRPVAALVHRMLIKNREQRPMMPEVATELEALSAATPPSRRRSTASVPVVSVRGVETLPPASIAGTAAGQAGVRNRRGRNLGFAGGVLVALSVMGVVTLRNRQLHSGRTATPTVQLRIDSTPPGALVVHVDSGRVLGTTPYTLQRPAQPGRLRVRLRLRNYADKELELDQSTDSSRAEALVALVKPAAVPAPAPTVPPESARPAGVSKAATATGAGGAGARKRKRKAGPKLPSHSGGRQIED